MQKNSIEVARSKGGRLMSETDNVRPLSSGWLNWLDVLKGFGIVTVVWGHSGHPDAYFVFFFHMPLFFFISGYLYKPSAEQPWIKYVVKKSKHLLIPYLFYIIAITLFLFLFAVLRNQPFINANWKSLILGGSLLEGVYGIFWFVTCLFFVQIFYDLLQRGIHWNWLKVVLLTGFYLLAYWESRYHQDIYLPWNIDVSLFAIIFYSFGNLFQTKKWFEDSFSTRVLTVISGLIITLFLCGYFSQFFDYGLDLKHRQYYYFGTNVLIPLCVIIIMVGLSILLTKWKMIAKVISSLGKSSMAIMYLHLVSFYIVSCYIALTPIRCLAIGLILPWVWYQVAKSIPGLKSIALGIETKGHHRLTKQTRDNLKL